MEVRGSRKPKKKKIMWNVIRNTASFVCGGCGVVWCGVIWGGVMWGGVVWFGVVWCGVVWCFVVRCNVV